MATLSTVTVIAARFDAPLAKGDDASPRPHGATLSAAGTETDWTAEDGLPRRERSIRIWMALWPDPEAAASWLADRAARIPILAQAIETVALLAHPFACHGQLNWSPDGEAASLYRALAPRPEGSAPILVMTTLGVGDPEDGLVEFGQGVAAVRAGFATNSAVLLDLNMLPDLPMIDGPTLTLWRSEADIVHGAYRSEPHRTAMKLRNGAIARASFTRMAVASAEGAWNGVDISRAVSRSG